MAANISNEQEHIRVDVNVLVIIHLELYISLKNDLAMKKELREYLRQVKEYDHHPRELSNKMLLLSLNFVGYTSGGTKEMIEDEQIATAPSVG